MEPQAVSDWEEDCMLWRGEVLKGRYAHWCFDWDDLPIDETCPEWPCECADELIASVAKQVSG